LKNGFKKKEGCFKGDPKGSSASLPRLLKNKICHFSLFYSFSNIYDETLLYLKSWNATCVAQPLRHA